MEKFNPRDPEYRQVSDLPEKERAEFINFEGGGFVRKRAYWNSMYSEEKRDVESLTHEALYTEEQLNKKLSEIQKKHPSLFEILEKKENKFDILSRMMEWYAVDDYPDVDEDDDSQYSIVSLPPSWKNNPYLELFNGTKEDVEQIEKYVDEIADEYWILEASESGIVPYASSGSYPFIETGELINGAIFNYKSKLLEQLTVICSEKDIDLKNINKQEILDLLGLPQETPKRIEEFDSGYDRGHQTTDDYYIKENYYITEPAFENFERYGGDHMSWYRSLIFLHSPVKIIENTRVLGARQSLPEGVFNRSYEITVPNNETKITIPLEGSNFSQIAEILKSNPEAKKDCELMVERYSSGKMSANYPPEIPKILSEIIALCDKETPH